MCHLLFNFPLVHEWIRHAGPRLAHFQPLHCRLRQPHHRAAASENLHLYHLEWPLLAVGLSPHSRRQLRIMYLGHRPRYSLFPPRTATAKKWLSHNTMYGILNLPDFQPGVNCLKYSARTSHAYYTSTQKRVFCRVSVDRKALEPTGEPEILAEGMHGDDLIIDDSSANRPVAYVTTRRDKSILEIHLNEGPGMAKVTATVEGSMEL